MFNFLKPKNYKTALTFFNKRQKVLSDYMTFKNKVSPDILALQIAKNTGIIATSLDHNVPFGVDAPELSNYRKTMIQALVSVCQNDSGKYTKDFAHVYKKMCAIEKSEELSKQAIFAVNSIIEKKVQEQSLVKLDDSFFDTGENKTFYHNVLSYMSDDQFAIRMSGLFVYFPYGKQLTMSDIYIALCAFEKFEDYTILFLNN